MFGKVAMEKVVRSKVAKFKWPIFGSNLKGGDRMAKKG